MENLLSWHHSGFSVHSGVRVEERAAAVRLGRSMARCPIVLDHVPEPRQQPVRSWGFYSNAARGKRRKAESGPAGAEEAPASAELDRASRRRRLSWARLIKKVYEIDQLLCPYCESPMKIVAFVVELGSLRRLLRGLGVGLQEAEPLSRAPPQDGELVYEAVEG